MKQQINIASNLTQQFDELSHQNSQLQQSLYESNQKFSTIQIKFSTLQKKFAELQSQNLDLQKQLHSLTVENSQLKTAPPPNNFKAEFFSSLSHIFNSTITDFDQVQSILRKLTKRNQTNTNSKTNQELLEHQKSTVEQLRQSKRQIELELETARSDKLKAELQAQNKESEANRLRESNSQKDERIIELTSKLAEMPKLSPEIELIIKEHGFLKYENSELRAKLAKAHTAVEILQRRQHKGNNILIEKKSIDHQKVAEELDAVKSELKTKEQENLQLKQKLAETMSSLAIFNRLKIQLQEGEQEKSDLIADHQRELKVMKAEYEFQKMTMETKHHEEMTESKETAKRCLNELQFWILKQLGLQEEEISPSGFKAVLKAYFSKKELK